jgi:hypothetical protein
LNDRGAEAWTTGSANPDFLEEADASSKWGVGCFSLYFHAPIAIKITKINFFIYPIPFNTTANPTSAISSPSWIGADF